MISLKSLLRETIEFTPRGNLWIDGVDSIPPDKWERINTIMVNKGYNMRGGDDCKKSMEKFLSNPNNKESQTINSKIFGDWVSTIAMVMGIKPAKETDEFPKYDKNLVIRAAIRAYGITNDIREAGYILPSGKLLSLSHEGGKRDLDHREINSVYSSLKIQIPLDKAQSNSNIMHAFMRDCHAIRIGGTQPMADMWSVPTQQQAKQLIRLIQFHHGELLLVCRSAKFGQNDRSYPSGTNPIIILKDIVNFYKSGEFITKG